MHRPQPSSGAVRKHGMARTVRAVRMGTANRMLGRNLRLRGYRLVLTAQEAFLQCGR